MKSRKHLLPVISLSVALCSLASPSAQAEDQVGTLVQLDGGAEIFSHPADRVPEQTQGGTRALYDGKYYLVKPAKTGDRIEKGNILRTSPSGKARVIYDNGDQFNVGPGSSYRISWGDAKDGTKVQLEYGSLRGVIAKGGPRSKLQVRTRNAVMGVRGTDFFIEDSDPTRGTEVSVLRGQVDLKPEKIAAKTVQVAAGYSAAVPDAKQLENPMQALTEGADQKQAGKDKAAKPPVAEIKVEKTTQDDLLWIKQSSALPQLKKEELQAQPEVAKKVEQLQEKAVETTLKDIKTYDPKLFAELEKSKIHDIAQLDHKEFETAVKVAPKAPEKRKPRFIDQELRDSVYEKYFPKVE